MAVSGERFRGETVLQVVMALLSVSTAYLGGPYFLTPYYAILGDERYYDKPVDVALPKGNYMLSVKTTTGIPNFHERFSVSAAMYADEKRPGHCPRGLRSNLYDEWKVKPDFPKCVRQFQNSLRFYRLSTNEEERRASYRGPHERPFQIDEFFFSIAEGDDEGKERVKIKFVLELLRFQYPTAPCAKPAEDCEAFSKSIVQDETVQDELYYDSKSLRCVPYYQKEVYGADNTGCAIRAHLGSLAECYGNEARHRHWDPFNVQLKNEGVCSLSVFWTLFSRPPAVFTAGQVWSWGVIGMISSLFMWLSVVQYFWYRLHLNYLAGYYFRTSHLTLTGGNQYDYKVLVTGKRFTRAVGRFTVFASGTVVFEQDLRAHFEHEDVTGEELCTIVFRGSFPIGRSTDDSSYSVTWTGEFRRAGFAAPVTRVELRQRVPRRVKTIANVVLCPIFFLIGLVTRRPKRAEFLRYADYIYLVAYMSGVYMTGFSILIFMLFAYISTSYRSDRLRPLFWGSLGHNPALPVPLYFLYVVLVFVPFFLSLLRRYCARVGSGSLNHAVLIKPNTTDSHGAAAFTGGRGRRMTAAGDGGSAHQRRATSHLHVEYVALDASRRPADGVDDDDDWQLDGDEAAFGAALGEPAAAVDAPQL